MNPIQMAISPGCSQSHKKSTKLRKIMKRKKAAHINPNEKDPPKLLRVLKWRPSCFKIEPEDEVLEKETLDWLKGVFAWILFTRFSKYYPGIVLTTSQGHKIARWITLKGTLTIRHYGIYQASDDINQNRKSKRYINAIKRFIENSSNESVHDQVYVNKMNDFYFKNISS